MVVGIENCGLRGVKTVGRSGTLINADDAEFCFISANPSAVCSGHVWVLFVWKQVKLAGFGDGEGAFVDAQFAVDVFDVVEDGVEADEKLLGNLFVFQPSGDEG